MERPTQVRETGSGFLGCVAIWSSRPRCLKTFTCAGADGTNDWQLGKHLHRPVVETYTYGGKQGRTSKRDTSVSVSGGSPESFTQSWVWNDRGDPASVTYP